MLTLTQATLTLTLILTLTLTLTLSLTWNNNYLTTTEILKKLATLVNVSKEKLIYNAITVPFTFLA